jgi:hypothetical protein
VRYSPDLLNLQDGFPRSGRNKRFVQLFAKSEIICSHSPDPTASGRERKTENEDKSQLI